MALVKALRSADWSGVSIGNKALIEAAVTSLEKMAEKLDARRVLLDKLCSHLTDINALDDFGPELYKIINNDG